MHKTRLLLTLMCAGAIAGCTHLEASTGQAQPGQYAAGERFRDCRACPEMIVVPAGKFVIGSPDDEAGRIADEGPQREVIIARPFAVGRYEVTRQQYEAFLRATNHPVSGNCVTDRRKPGTWAADPQTNFRDPGFEQTGDHPAACVSWNDAKAYIAWLNSQTSGDYRLLSEAEWEYVARAGSTTAYPWGGSVDDGCAHMNGFDQSIRRQKGNLYFMEKVPAAECEDGYVNTSPAGAFAPNAFGVYDMIGNLAEWTEDCTNTSYASLRADGTHGETDCKLRMTRGGSWGTNPRQLRSAERIRYAPDAVDDSIGIRVAKTLRLPGRAS